MTKALSPEPSPRAAGREFADAVELVRSLTRERDEARADLAMALDLLRRVRLDRALGPKITVDIDAFLAAHPEEQPS